MVIGNPSGSRLLFSVNVIVTLEKEYETCAVRVSHIFCLPLHPKI